MQHARFTLTFVLLIGALGLAQQPTELGCEGIFLNAPNYHSFEIHKDSTCISRTGIKPYNYKEASCTLAYSPERKYWYINNLESGEIKFTADCATMSFISGTFKSVATLPFYPSAPFPERLEKMAASSLPANVSRLQDSIVKLGRGCSGTWLSNDGYFLTAMHCLHPELLKNGIATAVSEPESTPSAAQIGFTGIKITNFQSIPLKPAPESANGLSLFIDGVWDTTPRLIAAGPGSLYKRPFQMHNDKWNITQEQFARSEEIVNEFVILKYDLSKQAPVTCSPIRTTPLVEEESVWTNGFTRLYDRKNEKRERVLVSAQGRAYDKITSVKMAAPYLMAKPEPYGDLKTPSIVYSDARVSSGMSGGPLTDAQGNIVGINSFAIEKKYNQGSFSEQSGFVRISTMYDDLKSKMPTDQLNKIFDCKNIASKKTELVSCPTPEKIKFQILSKMERRGRNFTQGLEFYQGAILESTGAHDKQHTQLNLLLPDGSQTVLSEKVQKGTFGEGLTVLSHKIFQATWKDRRMFVFNIDGSWKQTLNLPYEGWGLTNDGNHLILTDGSDKLRFLNPSNLSVVKELTIRMNGESIHEVNELEWIKGKIFGNVFLTKNIVRINPSTGCVDGIMDASEIMSQLPDDEREFLGWNSEFAMNGIAFNPANDEIYLTGKNWKYLFTVKIQK